MKAVGVIPVRYASTRFPGKALAPIGGVPMVHRVWAGARSANTLRAILVATDDERIADACREFGADVVLTRPDHPTGTDRLAEVAAELEDDVVVNIQGDEPLIEGFVIDAAVEALIGEPKASMSTVVHTAEPHALRDENRVLAVLDGRGFARSFSRRQVSAGGESGDPDPHWQHVGVYAYRRAFLLDFVKLARGRRERAEDLEQLRALEHGHRIRCAVVDGWRSAPVDVPADIETVEARLREAAAC